MQFTEELETQISEYLADKYRTKFETVIKQDVFILALVAEVNRLRQTIVSVRHENDTLRQKELTRSVHESDIVRRCKAEDAAIKRAMENQ